MQERTGGIDLASEEHRLIVVEAGGRQLEKRRVVHTEVGIDALVRRLGKPAGRTLAPFSALRGVYLSCSAHGSSIASSSRIRRWVVVRRSRAMPSAV